MTKSKNDKRIVNLPTRKLFQRPLLQIIFCIFQTLHWHVYMKDIYFLMVKVFSNSSVPGTNNCDCISISIRPRHAHQMAIRTPSLLKIINLLYTTDSKKEIMIRPDNTLSWKMSRLMTKPTKWHVLPTKTPIRDFAVHIKKAWVLSYPLSAQRRL